MIRVGIIGTGRIAQRFQSEASVVKDMVLSIVYNPHLCSAEHFAKDYTIPAYTNRLEDLFGQVEAVYIASPHETHYAYAKQMLEHRIHVLCEKPLVLQGIQAEELFQLAATQGCVLMEAIKTAYCPGFAAMIETAKSGVIGSIREVEACFTRLTPTNVRELTDATYGGSFTEMGTYTMLPLMKLLGTAYDHVDFRSQQIGNGLDGYTRAEFTYAHAYGACKTGLLVKSEGQLLISGTKGYILAKSPWWMTKEYEVRFEDPSRCEAYTYDYAGAGLRYEIEAWLYAIRGGDSGQVTPEESICMANIMERFLQARAGKPAAVEGKQPMKIWAHRGSSFAYPENTLEAFEAAAKLAGLTGIELDVQLTLDGEPVVIHDEYVDRTTDGSGAVRNYTLQQIRNLNIAAGDHHTAIPTLREVFTLLKPYCEHDGLLMNIELKNSVIRYEGMEEKVLRMVREYELEPYVWYSSFLPESLETVKLLNPEASTGVLAVSLEACLAIAREVTADAVHPYIGGLDAALPQDARGLPIRAWNGEERFFGQEGEFQERDLKRYAAFGVTDVFTNVPERYLGEEIELS
ncbi:MAG: glycerophosphodiester phosphodiesterase family protein [Hungatella sp.]